MNNENVESKMKTPIVVEIGIHGTSLEQLLYAQAVIVPEITKVLSRFDDVGFRYE